MIKSMVLAVLWFLAAWSSTAMVAFVVGLPGWISPIAATIAAAVILVRSMYPAQVRLVISPT